MAAKRERKVSRLPCRQATFFQAEAGKWRANCLTETCDGCAWLRLRAAVRKANAPGSQTMVGDSMPATYCNQSWVMAERNGMPFPYPASASTTPTGTFCSTARRICCTAISGLL
jgi:hypothetical protein